MNTEEYSDDFLFYGVSEIIKVFLIFSILIAMLSVFVIILGWFIKMAFSEFSLFQATLIPLSIIGVAFVFIGLMAVWMRLGDVVSVLNDTYYDYEDEDEDEDEEEEKDDLIWKQIIKDNSSAKVTPINIDRGKKKKNIN